MFLKWGEVTPTQLNRALLNEGEVEKSNIETRKH